MDCSTPGFPVHHQLPELAQTHVHRVGDAIQPFHPLSSPSLLAFDLIVFTSVEMQPYLTNLSWKHFLIVMLQSCVCCLQKFSLSLSFCGCYLVLSHVQFFCSPTDHSPPGSSVHEISQARILEWVSISFSRGSFQPRDRTWVSHIVGRFFTV